MVNRLRNLLLAVALFAPLASGIQPAYAADLSVTAGSVLAGAAAQYYDGTAGATITAGQAVYLDSATTTLKLAKANSATTAEIKGIALQSVSSGQPLKVITAGTYNPGGTVTVGTLYVLSAATAGSLAPSTDLATTNKVSLVGIATTSSAILLKITNTGIAIP